jgi:uncharacterized membrane protein YhaH (DUF805 family)
MTLRLLFWILMLLWLVLGIGGPIYMGYGGNAIHIGGNLLLFAIIAVLGWKVFGKPVTDA